MTILGRIRDFFIQALLSLTDEKAWNRSLWRPRGSVSSSGEFVTEETALSISAVFNAISLISGTIGALPLHLMKKVDRKKKIIDNRPIHWVMYEQWNPIVTAMAGREAMVAHILAWGNGYAEKVIDGYGDIVELWPIPPNRVTMAWYNGELIYQIRVDRETVNLGRNRILHVPGLGFDGFQGYSVVEMARRSLGLAMAMETFGSLYFGQGTHPGVVISHPGSLSDKARGHLEDSLTKAHSGLGKTHRLMLLEEAMKIEKLGIAPEESQFLESRQFQITEVARWFNLPPHKIKDLSRSSFSNIESEQISFVTDSILPWLVRLEQNYNVQLLTKEERRNQKLYFKHSVEGLLRGDAAARGSFYSQLWNIGSISINEIREKEDMDPIEGGDKYFIPLNMSPLNQPNPLPEPPKNPKMPALPQPNQQKRGKKEEL